MISTDSHHQGNSTFSRTLDVWNERADLLWQIFGPVILILGIPGNILTIAVLNSFSTKSPALRFFQALSVTDLLYLCIVCLFSWIEHQFQTHPKHINVFMCVVYRWGGYSIGLQSIVFLVVITVHRVIAVSYPLHVRALCTVRRAHIIIADVVFACFITYSYFPFVIKYEKKCDWTSSYRNDGMEITKWLNATLFLFFPVTVLLFSNCFLIRTLLKSTHNSVSVASSKGTKNIFLSTVNVVVVSITLSVLTLPFSIINLAIQMNSTWDDSRDQFVREMALLFMCTKSAINFFYYIWTGESFRKQAVLLAGLVFHMPFSITRTVMPLHDIVSASTNPGHR